MLSSILIGHDGSERSSGAAGLGQALAGFTGARLLVGAAFSPQDADRALASARAPIGACPRVESRAIPGAGAADGLGDLAQRERCDLITGGTSHRAVVAGVAVGSVSEHLLRCVPCPVAVVPPDSRRPPLARLGVACDGS